MTIRRFCFFLVLVMIGGVNLLCGTWSFLQNVVKLVRRNAMSLFALVPTFALGTLHVLLWFAAMALYMGVIDIEEEVDESDGMIDSKKNVGKSNRGSKP